MRIPKEGYYVHRAMWGGWVDTEQPDTYIIGPWDYPAGVHKPVYVVSTSPSVELYLNGRSLGQGRRDYDFLFTFDDVAYEPGTLLAVGRSEAGVEQSRCAKHTASPAAALRLTLLTDPEGLHADGADMALVQVEVVDSLGRRCPLDHRFVSWTLEGPAEWRGGLAKSPDGDNYILARKLPVEGGVSRVLVRSTTDSGLVTLTARASGLPAATLSFATVAVAHEGGLSTYIASAHQPLHLERGETPLTPSYRDRYRTLDIASATAGAHADNIAASYDDNELTGWRQRSYPLEVVAETESGEQQVVWRGDTPKSLGYVQLHIDSPVEARRYTLRQIGSSSDKEAFGQIVEVAAPTAGELDLYKTPGSEQTRGELRIVEVDFLQKVP
jgi:hypothetical protein